MENGRQPYNLWITILLSGDISAMIFEDTNLTISGAVTKTDLSLVDKIELGRTYEEVSEVMLSEVQKSNVIRSLWVVG